MDCLPLFHPEQAVKLFLGNNVIKFFNRWKLRVQ